MSPLVRLSRRRHGLTFELGVRVSKFCDIFPYGLWVDMGCVSESWGVLVWCAVVKCEV